MNEISSSGTEWQGKVHLDEPRCRYTNTVHKWCDVNGENEDMKLTAEIGSVAALMPKMTDDVNDMNNERYWNENTKKKLCR